MADDTNPMGARLQAAREAAKLTQGKVARELDIDPSSLSRWERGIVESLKAPMVQAMATLYGVRLEWLMTGSGPMRDAASEPIAGEGYPAVEDFIRSRPDLAPGEIEALRGFRLSGGPSEVTAEVLEGLVMGIRMRDKLRARPRLTE